MRCVANQDDFAFRPLWERVVSGKRPAVDLCSFSRLGVRDPSHEMHDRDILNSTTDNRMKVGELF